MSSEDTRLVLPPRESAEFSADTAAQTQEARLTPFPGTGEFRPRRASAFLVAFGGGDFARCGVRGYYRLRRRGRAPPGARGKRGYRTPLRRGFLSPLLRLPLTFRSAAMPFGHAAKARGTQLRPLYHLGRFDAGWGWRRARFPRISVRGSGFRSGGLETVCVICPDCSRRAG